MVIFRSEIVQSLTVLFFVYVGMVNVVMNMTSISAFEILLGYHIYFLYFSYLYPIILGMIYC